MGKAVYGSIMIFCEQQSCEVVELNVQEDHVHLLVLVPPKLSVSKLVGILKRRSAIRLFNKFPHLRKTVLGESLLGEGLLRRHGGRGR